MADGSDSASDDAGHVGPEGDLQSNETASAGEANHDSDEAIGTASTQHVDFGNPSCLSTHMQTIDDNTCPELQHL